MTGQEMLAWLEPSEQDFASGIATTYGKRETAAAFFGRSKRRRGTGRRGAADIKAD